jgi:hypothetical protein
MCGFEFPLNKFRYKYEIQTHIYFMGRVRATRMPCRSMSPDELFSGPVFTRPGRAGRDFNLRSTCMSSGCRSGISAAVDAAQCTT